MYVAADLTFTSAEVPKFSILLGPSSPMRFWDWDSSILYFIAFYGFSQHQNKAMVTINSGNLPEEELPIQSSQQSFPPMVVNGAESPISPDEIFSYLISTSTDDHSVTGGQTKELYQCRPCGKQFGRLDHVKRHCRSREFSGYPCFNPDASCQAAHVSLYLDERAAHLAY